MKYSFWTLITIIVIQTGCSKNNQSTPLDIVSIVSISPSSGPAGTAVVIKGTNFSAALAGNTVRFNNDSAVVLSVAGDSLVAVAPANGTTGPVTVSVSGNIATGPVFTYTADSVDVYVAGPSQGVTYWKNGIENYIEGTQANIGGAYGVAVSDTDVYIAGFTFNTQPTTIKAAYWKNNQKIPLSDPNNTGEARALVISGSDVYVGGSESNKPVYWKNGQRNEFAGSGRINGMAVNGADVYAVGLDENGSVLWKNGVKTVLGTRPLVDGGATSVAVDGNDVYVCSTDSGDAVYWKNGMKVTLEKFPGDVPVAANAIAVYGNSVYVAGDYKGNAVYWKDGVKTIMPGNSPSSASAHAIAFYKSDIYVGGRDGSAPAYWKNGVKATLCCSILGTIKSIAVVKPK